MVKDLLTNLRRSEHVLFQQYEDRSGKLFDLSSGRYYWVDPGGCLIWHMICEERNFMEIAQTLSTTYGNSDEYTVLVLTNYLERLQQLGLIYSVVGGEGHG